MPTDQTTPAPGARVFATTRWTVVLQAGGSLSTGSQSALAQLCRTYWYPLYSFLRRRGLTQHDAEDMVQSFFAFLMEKDVISRADRERGRFRTFLLSALQNFQSNERARAQSQKRGGGQALLSIDEADAESRFQNEPATHLTPERLYDQKWAASLLNQVLQTLSREYSVARKGPLFDAISVLLWGGRADVSYEEIGRKLGMTEGAVKVAVHRLRLRYKECLQEEVAHTVASPAEVEEELRYLLASLDPAK